MKKMCFLVVILLMISVSAYSKIKPANDSTKGTETVITTITKKTPSKKTVVTTITKKTPPKKTVITKITKKKPYGENKEKLKK